MALIKKNWRKDASNTAMQATMRVLGAGITAVALQKLPDLFTSENIKQTVKNISAPLVSGALVAGDLLLDNPYLKAVCQGGYSFGFLKTASVIIRGSGAYMGLQGIPDTDFPKILNGVVPRTNGIMNGTPSYSPSLPAPSTTPATKFAKVADYAAKTAKTDYQTAALINGVNDTVKAQSVAQSML